MGFPFGEGRVWREEIRSSARLRLSRLSFSGRIAATMRQDTAQDASGASVAYKAAEILLL